jgi:uncharacterized protein YhaN
MYRELLEYGWVMTGPEWMQALGGLAAGVAAVLAWVAKIRWSQEFKEAKEAQVRVLEEKVGLYKAASSPVLLQLYQEQKVALEGVVGTLRNEIEVLQASSAELEEALAQARTSEAEQDQLRAEIERQRAEAARLQRRLRGLERVTNKPAVDGVIWGISGTVQNIETGEETEVDLI